MGGEGLEKLAHEFAIEGAYFRLREFCPEDQKRPARDIDRNPRKGLVHRQKHIRETGDAGHVAQGLAHRLTERYADFNQVGFLAFQRWDGQLIDAGTHPVKYLQQA